MITRIEIDGFKSFRNFTLDVPPLLALVGPTAGGKSNLFDALDYEAAARAGGFPLVESGRGRPHELVHRVANGRPVDGFSIRVHRLVRVDEGFIDVVSVAGAGVDAGPFPADRGHHLSWSGTDQDARFPQAVRDRLWRLAGTVGDGSTAPDTVLSTARRIVAAIGDGGILAPDPRAMRGPGWAADLRPLARDGANLAAVLGRLRDSAAFDDLTADLTAVIPEVERVVPEFDDKRQEWFFDLIIDGQGPVPSTLLSAGTLRTLGLLTALHDPEHPGVVMIEEIETGLPPSRVAELLRRVQTRVSDLADADSLERPLRQVIVTSHSPVVVAGLYGIRPDSLVVLNTAVSADDGRTSRVTVARPAREDGDGPGSYLGDCLDAVGRGIS
ncbi:MAG TPA: ATP-binding protein [Streptosporangiaceae bacterium]|nr:ATP-binding protein [Streptosporangiaceae bacterium]